MLTLTHSSRMHLCIVYLLGITIGLVTDTFMAAVGRLFNKMQIILKLEYLEMRWWSCWVFRDSESGSRWWICKILFHTKNVCLGVTSNSRSVWILQMIISRHNAFKASVTIEETCCSSLSFGPFDVDMLFRFEEIFFCLAILYWHWWVSECITRKSLIITASISTSTLNSSRGIFHLLTSSILRCWPARSSNKWSYLWCDSASNNL